MNGRRILVTGAAGGIGTSLVAELLLQGARVLATDVDESGCRLLERRIGGRPEDGRLHTMPLDLTESGAPQRIVDRAIDRLGGLDGLVNNAGVEHRAALAEHGTADWTRVLEINLSAPFRLARAAAPALAGQPGAAIVNVCSIAVTGFAGQAAYDASKGGLLSLTRSLAVELGPLGVRANAVCPGFIDTPMLDASGLRGLAEKVAARLPLGRCGHPEEVAAAIVWLLGTSAGYVTGQALFVDGGMVRA
ncbi:3-oxoacyl-[acyl-carrier protein] reductase [Thermomonospora echinospora]|uniref:3-oxoacyl-[acyl-carrier protein] reductase n=1 Tax=Thermomonospora echinospora TaxID=1992 RepID=A0A1H5YN81_9ACTN|nr:SDR family NAD(P)-dependent oxidoreductase [Thermomonospora echinospora]SEG25538.1 3-oxoacyl-[acyl-carrier protein] reductase [Thermomonospora echinospora]